MCPPEFVYIQYVWLELSCLGDESGLREHLIQMIPGCGPGQWSPNLSKQRHIWCSCKPCRSLGPTPRNFYSLCGRWDQAPTSVMGVVSRQATPGETWRRIYSWASGNTSTSRNGVKIVCVCIYVHFIFRGAGLCHFKTFNNLRTTDPILPLVCYRVANRVPGMEVTCLIHTAGGQ